MRLDENRKSHLTVKPKTVLASANGHSNISVSSVPDASEWTIQDVADYLTAEGFQNEASFFKEQVNLLIIKPAYQTSDLVIVLWWTSHCSQSIVHPYILNLLFTK